jgi:hypothetical protein
MDPNVMTSPDAGEIATLVLDPASSVTVAVPDFVGSTADLALIVTVGGVGTAAGAM